MINISKYSSRFDFCDYIMMSSDIGIIGKNNVFVGRNIVPLCLLTELDLVPYYPYTVVATDENNIFLSNESSVDKQEREILEFLNSSAISYWRKLKKKKIDFGVEEIANHIAWGFSPHKDHIEEIAKRVVQYGTKATTKDIHIPSYEFYRDNLYDKMIETGWDMDVAYRWCYGFSRWMKRVSVK